MPLQRSFGFAASLLCLALFVSACGGGNKSSLVPSAQSSAKTHPAKPRPNAVAGITSAELQGAAAAQLSAERSRRSGRALGFLKRCEGGAAHLAIRGSGTTSALVLYDTAGQWGYLGELYALATANLSGHFGSVYTEPVSSYSAGQMRQYTAVAYIGSTYYDATTDQVPKAFYADVASGQTPVIWMNDNIWNFANAIGVSAFENRYGWDPTTSYFAPSGSVGSVTQVVYKNVTMTRQMPQGSDGGVLHPNILGGRYPAVTVLAQAFDTSTNPAKTFPWAIRSSNLTYIGEVPFQYVSEKDRVIAFEDLLFDALAPSTPTQHRAMVRLEDIDAQDDPDQLFSVAQDLYNRRIPYGFNVIPLYMDPLGYYNNGVPQTIPLTSAPRLVLLIYYMLTHGGTIIDEGYTHQYGAVANPYTGVSGDDAEFFRAHIAPDNSVVWDGPVAEDSSTWALGRVNSAVAAFGKIAIRPRIWVTPHYFATDVDYRAIATAYSTRYERAIYFTGLLSGGPVNHAQYIGEFFPYAVNDVYGSRVLPENLGDYEPVPLNNNPVRLPTDIVSEAAANLAVRDGYASFFYDPRYGTGPLDQTLTGIQNLGYTFVSPATQ